MTKAPLINPDFPSLLPDFAHQIFEHVPEEFGDAPTDLGGGLFELLAQRTPRQRRGLGRIGFLGEAFAIGDLVRF